MSSLDSWIDKSELENLTRSLVSPKKTSAPAAPASEPPTEADSEDSPESEAPVAFAPEATGDAPDLQEATPSAEPPAEAESGQIPDSLSAGDPPAPENAPRAEPARKKSIILRPGPDGKLFRPKPRNRQTHQKPETEVTPLSESPRPVAEADSPPETKETTQADPSPEAERSEETVGVSGPPARARIASEALAAARSRADESGLIRRSSEALATLTSSPSEESDFPTPAPDQSDPEPEPVALPEFPNFASFTLPQRLAVFAEWTSETCGAEDLTIADIDGYTLYPPPTSNALGSPDRQGSSNTRAASRLSELLRKTGIAHIPAPDGRWDCTLHASSGVGGLHVSMTVPEQLPEEVAQRIRACLIDALAG